MAAPIEATSPAWRASPVTPPPPELDQAPSKLAPAPNSPPELAGPTRPLKLKKLSWADVAGEAIEAEFTEVKRKQYSGRPAKPGATLRAARLDRVLVKVPPDYPLKRDGPSGLKLRLSETLGLPYDQVLYAGFTKTSVAARFSDKAGDALKLCLEKGVPAKPDGGYAFFYPNVPYIVLAYNGPRDVRPLIVVEVKAAIG